MSLYRNRGSTERHLLAPFVRLSLLAAATVGPSVVASPARAAPATEDSRFATVGRLMDSADFEGAEAAELQLLASGTLSRADTARAYLGLGIVQGARGKMVDAELDFLRAIVLEPTVELPATVGPEVTEVFVRAHRRFEAAPRFDVRVEVDRTNPHAGVVVKTFVHGIRVGLIRTLDVEGDRLRLRFLVDEDKPAASYVALAPNAPCQPLRVALRDEYGNELWRFAEDSTVCDQRPKGNPRTENVEVSREVPAGAAHRPIGAPVWVGAAISANLIVTTSVLGIAALNARADYHDIVSNPDVSRAQKQSEHDHASRLANLATAAGVGALAALGVTAFLYLSQSKGPARPKAPISQIDVSLGERRAFAGVRIQF